MTATVMLFAAARDHAGAESIVLDLPDGATVADLRREMLRRFPLLERLLRGSAIARNQEYAQDSDRINPTDELAVIPPVSGG
jgi:molybdopterin converting factor subunit 1